MVTSAGVSRVLNYNFRISNIVIRRVATRAVFLSKNFSCSFRSEVVRDRAEHAGEFPCEGKCHQNDRGDKQQRRGKADRIAEHSV